MTHSDEHSAPPPWYRQFWPWFILAWPASAVVAGIATVIIAVNNPDGLVEDDYYKAGLAINRTLEREQRAQELGLQARARWQAAQQRLELHLRNPRSAAPSRLILKLIHPTRAGFDFRIPLLQQRGGHYLGLLPVTPIAGHWNLVLEPEDGSWRLSGRARLPQAHDWTLTP
jgi:hypothetical protein